MQNEFHLKTISPQALAFECLRCGWQLFARLDDSIEIIERKKRRHVCHEAGRLLKEDCGFKTDICLDAVKELLN